MPEQKPLWYVVQHAFTPRGESVSQPYLDKFDALDAAYKIHKRPWMPKIRIYDGELWVGGVIVVSETRLKMNGWYAEPLPKKNNYANGRKKHDINRR